MATKELRRSFEIAEDGSGLRVGIVSTHSHAEIVGPLVSGTKKSLLERGVGRKHIQMLHVARPFDLPFAAKTMLKREKYSERPLDAIICLGCMVRDEQLGERFAFESEAVALAIMKLNIKSSIPVVYGVLTCVNEQQALGFIGKRSSGEQVSDDHGWEWAKTAIALARLSKSLQEDAEDEAEREKRVKSHQAMAQPATLVT